MSTRIATLSAIGLAALLGSAGLARAEDPVSPDRLVRPEPENWLMAHGNYALWRHSTLNQITPANVGGLKFAFAVPMGLMPPRTTYYGNDTQGIVLANGGMLYSIDPTNSVYKIDASSGKRGKVVWTFDPEIQPLDGTLNTARGVALTGTAIIDNTPDGRVIAIDNESGEAIWDKKIGGDGEGFDAQPVAIKDMVMVGQSYGDMGTRGYAVALNAATGEQVWRFDIVPGPGEPGHETWPADNESWKTGGGGLWTAPSYDPDLNLIYYGSGNPAPAFDAEYRAGDNLYTASTVALDADTGKLKWYHQYTPNDGQEKDEIGTNLLVDYDGNKLLSHLSRTGFFFTFDRASGGFIHAVAMQDNITWTKGIDPKTGQPIEYNPNARVQQYVGKPMRGQPAVEGCGGVFVTGIWPVSYDPDLKRIFNATADNQCITMAADPSSDEKMPKNNGAVMLLQGMPGKGSGLKAVWNLLAIDPVSGERLASAKLDTLSMSGTLSAPGLVFLGHPDGTFEARDSTSLDVLWSANVGMPIKAAAISYAVGGKQYIAFEAGAPPSSPGVAGAFPEASDVRNVSMLWVFSL